MKDIVSAAVLQKALEKTINRYPYFKVKLRAGIFWHYLQDNSQMPEVVLESQDPCRKINRKTNRKFLFKILLYHKRISVEFSHKLRDGTGAMEFFKTLLYQYIRLTKRQPVSKDSQDIKSITSSPMAEESEDAYLRYYKKDIPQPRGIPRAYHLPGPLLPENNYRITTGTISVEEIKTISKEKGVTITELLIAIYLDALQQFAADRKETHPIRIMTPVNLRTIYPSQTMRNFFLTVLPGIDLRLGNFDFDEILKTVYHFMRIEVNDKYINQQISRNIGSEKNPFVRFIPLFVKIWFEKIIYRKYATTRHSGLLTNLNLISLPKELAEAIDYFDFIPNPNSVTKVNVGVVGFKKKLIISFGSLVEYTTVEKYFFRGLRKMGINVKITTNM
jgi:NRPS condensation-like uncharacterized protein